MSVDRCSEPGTSPLESLAVGLERDVFLRTLIRELSGVLEDVVGLAEASGFVSIVGRNMGQQINDSYRRALGVAKLDRKQVADVLLDLKARINGAFELAEVTNEKLVLVNSRCPFEDKVKGRTSMCMMTSNVFGHIAADNLGFAKVELDQTIAAGDPRCRVVVHLEATDESERAEGREYFVDQAEDDQATE